jgi:hypothetical protein
MSGVKGTEVVVDTGTAGEIGVVAGTDNEDVVTPGTGVATGVVLATGEAVVTERGV